jgi:hypothetical protein
MAICSVSVAQLGIRSQEWFRQVVLSAEDEISFVASAPYNGAEHLRCSSSLTTERDSLNEKNGGK